MSTLLLSHPACLNHLTPSGHPERPDRLRAIEQALEDEKFQSLARVEAPRGPLDIIALCHPADYIEAIRDIAPGEELTYDYLYERDGTEDEKWEKIYVCKCGAPTCRGTILAPKKKRGKK